MDMHRGIVVDMHRGIVVDMHRGIVVDMHRGIVVDMHRGIAVDMHRGIAVDMHRGIVTPHCAPNMSLLCSNYVPPFASAGLNPLSFLLLTPIKTHPPSPSSSPGHIDAAHRAIRQHTSDLLLAASVAAQEGIPGEMQLPIRSVADTVHQLSSHCNVTLVNDALKNLHEAMAHPPGVLVVGVSMWWWD